MELEKIIEQKYEKLGWKTFWIFVSERAKVAIFVGLLAFASALFLGPDLLTEVLLGLFLIIFLVTLLVSWLEYIRFGFLLDVDALRIQRGIFHREITAIPYRQIQDIDIERDILNQLTGTSQLVILTAGHQDKGEEGSGESEGIIPIIDKALAARLQQTLTSKANIQKVTMATPS